MLDFLRIVPVPSKQHKGAIDICPKFIICQSSDLMIRGQDFYAIYDEQDGLWKTSEQAAIDIIDRELNEYYQIHKSEYDVPVYILRADDADTGVIDKWHKYVQKQCRDHYFPLDEKVIFSNSEIKKTDYASRKLNYPLEKMSTPAYDEMMSVLYSDEERHKLEWAIGAIVSGDSKDIQKFMVLYGSSGTGKSTVLNIVEQLFDGYFCVFDAKSLGNPNESFALEPFKKNPLVGIQHDGDLSKIEDNTRLNSLVSHEVMSINEKFKSLYFSKINAFLFMGTNKPVKITDAKSGIIRRLIDVTPSGNLVSRDRYDILKSQIKFELPGIAQHCLEVYKENPGFYNNYIPVNMIGASNDFYNFILDSFDIFSEEKNTQLNPAYELYKKYCQDANVAYPYSRRAFKEELKNYFSEYHERFTHPDGTRSRSYYIGFLEDKFIYSVDNGKNQKSPKIAKYELSEGANDSSWLIFNKEPSRFDLEYADCPAQYAKDDENGTPNYRWDDVRTILKDLDTSKLHYVRVDQNHIVIDFDIKDENGNKSYEKNYEAASKWPATYAELSKSGSGIHLHYIYSGDISELSRIYSDEIEVKIFTGKSSLRRKVTKCCNLPVAVISSGLPLKGGTKMVNFNSVQSERGLRTLIARNLNKEIWPNTKPSIDFIFQILDEAYYSGLHYDVTDMRPAILSFATSSSHQSDYCVKQVTRMKFHSDDISEPIVDEDPPIVFFDVEVFPNLFLLNWKFQGPCNSVVRMINPTSKDIEGLLKYRLIGFNNRRYDNHIVYARWMGYTNEQLYNLSQRIIEGSDNCFFGEAYNLSYTDIYDFTSEKKSLKKWEIELGIHHQELGLPWNEPVSEELWPKVAEYCDNDVIATEAVFDARQGDWIARQILSKIAGMTVNDTTNSLTTRIIFGKERHPQLEYTDLSELFEGYEYKKLDDGKYHNIYWGEDVGFGGYVYAEPGMYGRTITFDVTSMHPSSAIALNYFGDYTPRFKDILDARKMVKKVAKLASNMHKEGKVACDSQEVVGILEKLRGMLNGALAEFIKDPDDVDIFKALAQALKIAINSVYGLTSAKFDNPFRDPRNVNNIVALRGALFMVKLKHEIQDRGFTVAHIKTDSIKVVNPTKDIFDFIMDFGKKYGYGFEVEHDFEKICLVNDAVYIAKLSKDDPEDPGKWTATGAQFAVPYVFKKLFSKEPIEFSDLCETKMVTSALYLDMNENLPDVSEDEKRLEKYLKSNKNPDMDILDSFNYRIAKGHDYHFVGKAGQFCPILPGFGGGVLLREKDGKYSSATGAKGYRWLESEMVVDLGKQEEIDYGYYENLVDEAIASISEFGDFERFSE